MPKVMQEISTKMYQAGQQAQPEAEANPTDNVKEAEEVKSEEGEQK